MAVILKSYKINLTSFIDHLKVIFRKLTKPKPNATLMNKSINQRK